MSDDHDRPNTRVLHLGRNPRKFLGAVNTPVFRASTMLFPTVAALEQAARGEYEGIGYGLHGLPTVTELAGATGMDGSDTTRILSLRTYPVMNWLV